MKILLLCVGLSLLVALPIRADTMAQDADYWYQNLYAPLWKETPWEKVEKVLAFYDETILFHPSESPASAVSSRTWITNSLEEWKTEGWIGSVIAGYRSDQLNPSTAVFKVKWRDWYNDGRKEFSCGWYMADLKGESWIFTQFAEIDCAEQEL